jgi:hypothetical protein
MHLSLSKRKVIKARSYHIHKHKVSKGRSRIFFSTILAYVIRLMNPQQENHRNSLPKLMKPPQEHHRNALSMHVNAPQELHPNASTIPNAETP